MRDEREAGRRGGGRRKRVGGRGRGSLTGRGEGKDGMGNTQVRIRVFLLWCGSLGTKGTLTVWVEGKHASWTIFSLMSWDSTTSLGASHALP